MDFFRSLFSFEGRVNRAGYWLALLAIGLFLIALFILTRSLSALRLELPDNARLSLGVVLGIPYAVALFATLTKRLHDLNHSGWWVLMVVALYAMGSAGWEDITQTFPSLGYGWGTAIWARLGGDAVLLACLTLLGIRRGTRGPNLFGPDPLDSSGASEARS